MLGLNGVNLYHGQIMILPKKTKHVQHSHDLGLGSLYQLNPRPPIDTEHSLHAFLYSGRQKWNDQSVHLCFGSNGLYIVVPMADGGEVIITLASQ